MVTKKRRVARQMVFFAGIGGSAVLLDAAVYAVGLPFFGPFFGKCFSFVVGTFYTVTMNKYWTFKKPEFCKKELLRVAAMYGVSCTLNAGINAGVVNRVPTVLGFSNIFLGFVVATGASMVFNFLGLKFFVFRR